MSLQFIIGCSGSGKTFEIYKRLMEDMKDMLTSPKILIVPEQYTLNTQSELIRFNERAGLLNVEVLSFQRLFYRLYDSLGLAGKSLLNDIGKSMVLRKLIEDHPDEYLLLGRNVQKKGFIAEIKDFITEVYLYDMKAETFDQMRNEGNNAELSNKLNELEKLFHAYEDYLKSGFFTTESTLELLVEAIEKNSWLDGAEIYIDGFYGFTPIQYKIVFELMKKAKSVTIAITMDPKVYGNFELPESHLYHESMKMIETIFALSQSGYIERLSPVLMDQSIPVRVKDRLALAHLMGGLYRYPLHPFEEKTNDIKICKATSMRQECQYVADSILGLCMEKGFSFKEITVVTGDLSAYEDLLKQVFNLYKIPFFIDQKNPLITHPLIHFILAVLETIEKDFSYFSVFRLLKTNLLVDPEVYIDAIHLMENYVIAYGIRGKKMWSTEWKKPYPYTSYEGLNQDHSLLATINDIRTKVMAVMTDITELLSRKNFTVEEGIRGVYRFLADNGLEVKMKSMAASFEACGELTHQRTYTQIYKDVMEVFDQAVAILPEQKTTLKGLIELLKTGFEAGEMGLVPPGIDQVVVGDIERSRLSESRALFAIGLNEGKVPKPMGGAQIITDEERAKLIQRGIKMAPDQKSNIFRSQMAIYMALIRVKEKLFLSYSKSSADGKSLRPSMLIGTIKKLFPTLKILDLEEIYSNKLVVNRPKPTLKAWVQGVMNENFHDREGYHEVFRWFENPENGYRDAFNRMLTSKQTNRKTESLQEDHVAALYGFTMKNSVTRLETYAECPFKHFVNYGLRLRERLDYRVHYPDIGLYFHQAIDYCSRMIDAKGLDWNAVSTEELDLLVDRATSQVLLQDPRGVFSANARNAYLAKRLKRITRRAMEAIVHQVSKGEFRPIAFEKNFDGHIDSLPSINFDFDNQRSMVLTGRIDRIDAYESGDTVYLTVVDYKTGNKTLDLMAVYYGLQLQLFAYLNVVTEEKKQEGYSKVVPAGLFYFHIDDPMLNHQVIRDQGELEAQILKALKLNGLVLENLEVISKLDSSLEGASDVIPVTLKSDGSLSSSSAVLSEEVFQMVQKTVDLRMKEMGEGIAGGLISPNPYKIGNETACDLCGYYSVCQFNGANYKRFNQLNKKQVIEEIVRNN